MTGILAVCTGNAARSILAEAVLAARGAGRLRAFSAGTNPSGLVHRETLRALAARGYPAAGLRSKGWREFATPGAPPLRLVIALCPAAAAELPPLPGRPPLLAWPLRDPLSAPPDQIALAMRTAADVLEARVDALLALPFERMEPDEILDALEGVPA